MPTSTVLNQCENLQSDLDMWFQTCDASELREPTPFLDFLVSDINRQGLTQQVTPGEGKIHTVNLRYFQRFLESDATIIADDQANPNCTATGASGDNVAQYTIDETVNTQAQLKIDLKDLARVCRNNPAYIRMQISRLIDVLVRKVATKTSAEVVALSGKWDSVVGTPGGVGSPVNINDQLEVRTTKTGAPEEVSPFTMQDIDVAMMQSGYCQNGFIFAGTALWKYYDRVLAGCCANQGVDLGAIAREFGKVVQYDRRIVSAYADDNIGLLTQPGALALLTYTFSDSYDGGVNDIVGLGTNYFHTVINDPQSGLPLDLHIKDDCGSLHIVLTATTKLVALPATLFDVGDTKEGVNFVNEILVNNA